MSIFDGFLTQLGTGDKIKDWAHASKLFVDGNYRLSPKMAHLYHVFFELNPEITGPMGGNLGMQKIKEAGMLVKSIDLPKFSIDNKTLNSYNRPNIVQTKVKYDPVSMSFHDDSSDVVRQLWTMYYKHYYRDADGTVSRDGKYDAHYSNASKYVAKRDTNYGYSPASEVRSRPPQFISAIRIYSMHQKVFSEYILVNPIITSFKHGSHSASTGEPMQNDMTIAYEFALYNQGTVDSIASFGLHSDHYDKSPSPLKPANGTQSILGPGGLFDTVDGVLNAKDPLSGALMAYRGLKNGASMNLKNAALGELGQIGMDVLRGSNPLNRIAVPSISSLMSRFTKTPTTTSDSTTSPNAATSNGDSSVTITPRVDAGTQLAQTNGTGAGSIITEEEQTGT